MLIRDIVKKSIDNLLDSFLIVELINQLIFIEKLEESFDLEDYK